MGVVFLRSWEGVPEGFAALPDGRRCLASGSHLSAHVCENATTLRAAFDTEVVDGAFSLEKCAREAGRDRWDVPGRWYTTSSALESCLPRAVAMSDALDAELEARGDEARYDRRLRRCSDEPRAYCAPSLTAHWSGRPHLAARDFLLAHVLPHLPDCTDAQLAPTEQARKFCNYLGVESNAQLQCHLRSLNYTLVFTGGGFEHMPKCFSRDFGDCERGEGYVEEVEGLGELCVTWIAERLPAELLHYIGCRKCFPRRLPPRV